MNLDKTTANVITKFSDIFTKDCRVVLKALDPPEIARDHPHEKEINNSAEDIHSAETTTDSGKDTMSGISSTHSDENPLSQLFNKDRGRPCRRIKRVKYEESSPCSDSNSNSKEMIQTSSEAWALC